MVKEKVTPAPTPTPVLMLNLIPSPIRLRKNLLDSDSGSCTPLGCCNKKMQEFSHHVNELCTATTKWLRRAEGNRSIRVDLAQKRRLNLTAVTWKLHRTLQKLTLGKIFRTALSEKKFG